MNARTSSANAEMVAAGRTCTRQRCPAPPTRTAATVAQSGMRLRPAPAVAEAYSSRVGRISYCLLGRLDPSD